MSVFLNKCYFFNSLEVLKTKIHYSVLRSLVKLVDELYEDTVFEGNITASKYIKINYFKEYKNLLRSNLQ